MYSGLLLRVLLTLAPLLAVCDALLLNHHIEQDQALLLSVANQARQVVLAQETNRSNVRR
ncbi:hypothetical protein SAMN06265795_11041 [Noviherbaspirillum humi]|uniref:Uncharacterized protein n=1 Tax=Noviherbaspirillum humi TaxID=1688639 RepID=A0A239INF6_9BURK|nr:hypothetical protein SAMN06265795_11041 [Noviherbaspirillum humi]